MVTRQHGVSTYVACRRDSGKYTFSVACFMLELYQDDLADLLLPPQPKVPTGRQAGSFGTQVRVPKLEIKKDAKGMVSVPGATMIEVTCPVSPCRSHEDPWMQCYAMCWQQALEQAAKSCMAI